MWPLQRECDSFYGNPRGANGGPSAKWESANLVYVTAPFWMTFDGKPTRLRVHRKVAGSLTRILNAIWEAAGRDQAVIDAWGMSVTGGAYNFRMKRGGSSLSMHSWGCAVDFDPANNGMGDTTPKFAKHPEVLAAFRAEGWEWGGDWSGRNCDGMHWQAAWTRANAVSVTAKPAPRNAAPKPSAPASAPRSVAVTDAKTVSLVQGWLRNIGYAEVGPADGVAGTFTKAAIRAFRAESGLSPGDHIDDALIVALAKAEPRKLAPERVNATPAAVRATVPEAAAAHTNKLISASAAVGSGLVAAGGGIVQNFSVASEYIAPIKELAGDVPGWTWAAAAFVVAVIIWRTAAKGEAAAVAAVKDGSRR